MIHIRSQVKTTQSQSYKFKKIAKISNFEILQETLHVTHLMKFLYKMYKYEMDPTRTVEATVRTRDAGRTRDGRMDGRTEWNQYTPPTTSLCDIYDTIQKAITWTSVDLSSIMPHGFARFQWKTIILLRTNEYHCSFTQTILKKNISLSPEVPSKTGYFKWFTAKSWVSGKERIANALELNIYCTNPSIYELNQ